MKEEIGKIIDKNIDNNFTFEKNAFKNNQYCLADEIWNILDKYNKQPDFKGAWEELKDNYASDYEATFVMSDGNIRDRQLLEDIQELEQKYNLGGE